MSAFFDLSGKVALVTGGSRGLGYQMVKAFAVHGADVFITSRKLENCDKVAGEVRALGRKAATYACNVSNWQELDGLVDAAYAAFSKVVAARDTPPSTEMMELIKEVESQFGLVIRRDTYLKDMAEAYQTALKNREDASLVAALKHIHEVYTADTNG